jgi:hypothetical protein
MNLSRLIPVPEEIERRAWECAYVLATEFGQWLTAAEFNRWACVAAAGPGATGAGRRWARSSAPTGASPGSACDGA